MSNDTSYAVLRFYADKADLLIKCLTELGGEVYYPMISHSRRVPRKNKRVVVTRPAFQGYLFAAWHGSGSCADLYQDARLPKSWPLIERGPNGEPRVKLVSLEQIEALRDIERAWGVQGLPLATYVPLPDTVVKITAGPFQDELGTVVVADREQTKLMVGDLPVTMPTRLLERVTDASP